MNSGWEMGMLLLSAKLKYILLIKNIKHSATWEMTLKKIEQKPGVLHSMMFTNGEALLSIMFMNRVLSVYCGPGKTLFR